MRLIHHLDELDSACVGGVAMTIGVFDGIHRGHQALIKRARDQARMRALTSLVFTFEHHPLSLIAPAFCPPRLTQPAEKGALIKDLGVDSCLMLHFTKQIANIEAEQFVEEIIVRRCRAKFIICGWNFSFGAGGKGKPALLKQAAAEFGFDVEISDPIAQGASAISSTRVRSLLIDGQVRDAAELLGRRYGFNAEVVTGDQRGRQIGYPTANLAPMPDQLIPADGVYAMLVRAGGKRYGGMLNAGSRPTFEGAGRSIEVHLFDFDGHLVGETISIEFAERVRPEQKFDGIEALVAQLKLDEAQCRKICSEID